MSLYMALIRNGPINHWNSVRKNAMSTRLVTSAMPLIDPPDNHHMMPYVNAAPNSNIAIIASDIFNLNRSSALFIQGGNHGINFKPNSRTHTDPIMNLASAAYAPLPLSSTMTGFRSASTMFGLSDRSSENFVIM